MKQDTAKVRNVAVSIGAAMLGLFNMAMGNGLSAINAGTKARGYRAPRRYKANSKREKQRRWLADAYEQQRNSHKPGTVQPAHVFGALA